MITSYCDYNALNSSKTKVAYLLFFILFIFFLFFFFKLYLKNFNIKNKNNKISQGRGKIFYCISRIDAKQAVKD